VTPRATYRLQFRNEFTFDSASAIVPYLARLGISHIYASPILTARPGSAHGYDVVDHSRISDELGGEAAFRRLAAALNLHGMGMIVDIVPNHMAVGDKNAWWMDVLTHGRESTYARYFDIDWEPSDPFLKNKVLLPVLSAPLAETLARGEIRILKDAQSGEGILSYAEHRFPLRQEDRHPGLGRASGNFGTAAELQKLLEHQHYRLAWWRTAGDLINWRRFFDINDLVGLRMEDDAVFEAVHAKSLALYAEGLIDGFRVDHVDGLADPSSYCRKLRARLNALRSGGYLVVEKILAPGETLPDDWGVDGTTGYDFMNDASAVLHDPEGAHAFALTWAQISGRTTDFHVEERIARRELLQSKFHGAFEAAAHAFFDTIPDVSEDMTADAFRRALLRILGEMRIYRTYVTGETNSPAPGPFFISAVARALRRAPGNDALALRHIVRLFESHDHDKIGQRCKALSRFNQLAASLAAKAGEDTAFYRFGMLLSRDEVGSDPDEFALIPGEFHTRARARLGNAPMLATATHDHKRGEDARMRLAVLSELPTDWLTAISDWFELNSAIRDPILDRADEYQLYQTLVGAWPLDLDWQDEKGLGNFVERILAWRLKSLHEAKLRSSWGDPDAAYEEASADFVRRLLDPRRSSEFLSSFADFLAQIAPGAALNGLAQTTLRCTAPGVPDLYQGSELWDFSLVDPDNRRPVDFSARASTIAREKEGAALLRNWRSGETKLHIIEQLLGLRRRVPECFSRGDYRPQSAVGTRRESVICYLRSHDNMNILIVVPRLCARACMDAKRPLPAPSFWDDTVIPLPDDLHATNWHSLFDATPFGAAQEIKCADILRNFPIAALVNA
jgi:(1->4)-alpha-D-glucan 1-alpha-D-glucosylmutase